MKHYEHTMFTRSRPWGYEPVEVEEKMREFEVSLNGLINQCMELKKIINDKDATIKNLKNELRDMHVQMSSLELPDADEIVQKHVLDEFKDYNNPAHSDYPTPPPMENKDGEQKAKKQRKLKIKENKEKKSDDEEFLFNFEEKKNNNDKDSNKKHFTIAT